jgi:hypothetical protein
MSGHAKIADLEQRYIRLLESRIIQLEQRSLAQKESHATNRGVKVRDHPKDATKKFTDITKVSELDTVDVDSDVGIDGDHDGSYKVISMILYTLPYRLT